MATRTDDSAIARCDNVVVATMMIARCNDDCDNDARIATIARIGRKLDECRGRVDN